MSENKDIYQKLTKLLDGNNIEYRVMDHEPEGRTDLVSKIRGNELKQAVKSLVLMANIGKEKKYYLANIPGDKKVDFDAVKKLCNGSYVSFAPISELPKLTSCVLGAIPPFSFSGNLGVIVDPLVLENEEIVFNAGRLDKSIFMRSKDYRNIVDPIVGVISR